MTTTTFIACIAFFVSVCMVITITAILWALWWTKLFESARCSARHKYLSKHKDSLARILSYIIVDILDELEHNLEERNRQLEIDKERAVVPADEHTCSNGVLYPKEIDLDDLEQCIREGMTKYVKC